MTRKFFSTLAVCTAALTLTACESTREQFDFSKKAPDEFAVTTRAPLEMPSDMTYLPPPRPGSPRPQESAVDAQARSALFGGGQAPTSSQQVRTTPAAPSDGEQLILQEAGAAQAEPNIRDTIDAETRRLATENRSTVDRILGKVGRRTEAPAETINPAEETERLRRSGQIPTRPEPQPAP